MSPLGTLFDPTRRFGFGVNLDDPWVYAGEPPPKSIIIPRLLSVGRAEDADGNAQMVAQRRARSLAAAIELSETLKEAGIDFVRCWFPWKYFEPSIQPSQKEALDSSYERWPFDDFVTILHEHNIETIPVLACGYQRMLPTGLSPDSGQDEYLSRAAVHARLIVRHYKDKVRCWQIENEPNWWGMHSAAGWRKGNAWQSPGDFRSRLLTVLGDAVHAEDQNALTIVNLEADAKRLDASSYASHCDILGLDFYPNYGRSSPIDTSKIKVADDIANEVGKPVLLVETGYPTGPFLLGYTFSNQARYVRSAMLEAYGMDHVNGLGVWRYIDSSWKSFPYQENHFGLFDANGNPKPAWEAMANTIDELTS